MRAAAPTGRLVVVAPHMDDEVFGCGGTLGVAAAGGHDVTVATRKEESRRAAVRRLASALRNLQPDAIFLPFLTDVHHDHWLTNVIFAEAATASALRSNVTCWGYEVWTPVPANTVVDVSDSFDRKARAMAEFTSQTMYQYERAVVALNTYRSLFTARGAGFAEGFYTATVPTYLALYRAVAVGHRRARAVNH